MVDESTLADLEGIPPAARALWRDLVSEDLIPIAELMGELRAYQQALATNARWSDEVDPAMARAIGGGCLKLLSSVKDTTSEQTRRAIQAAVRYFIIEDDAESDRESVIGLDDDAEVLNAVLRHLDHKDWLVEIR